MVRAMKTPKSWCTFARHKRGRVADKRETENKKAIRAAFIREEEQEVAMIDDVVDGW
jgi:hypothetical protein